ncbi:Uncharacterised protein [[Clostridium] sordellii]|uniref:hypothetical protein n=1 Tax=Paraclostridium sordellii TaxID=1505 RepID=UPI0005E8ECC0|nr:hypothetical protein [Paeniclostridium sordellii]MDU1453906.1 hypothetical protein [Paeniclostridium sordellii]MDU7967331.1 hypothetical protein [Paeniclostridium sordellii]CEO05285.1 Uncharacterised protein [[Clostridium] sordellii] [Paeniclostridium sordellii]
MKIFKIKLTRDTFNFRFKQYEGTYFFGDVNEETQVVKYKITKDEQGLELKEFGNTHIKDNMLYIPQVEAYIDLNSLK